MQEIFKTIAARFRLLKNRRGMTLVNLMVALTLFLGAVVLFHQVELLSANIYKRSEQVRTATEEFIGSFYQNGTNKEVTRSLTLEAGGRDSIPLYGKIGKYESSGRTMYSFESE